MTKPPAAVEVPFRVNRDCFLFDKLIGLPAGTTALNQPFFNTFNTSLSVLGPRRPRNLSPTRDRRASTNLGCCSTAAGCAESRATCSAGPEDRTWLTAPAPPRGAGSLSRHGGRVRSRGLPLSCGTVPPRAQLTNVGGFVEQLPSPQQHAVVRT